MVLGDDRRAVRRRRADLPLAQRVTVVEVEVDGLVTHAERSDRLIEKLDARADRQDIMLTRLLAGLAVLMFLGQLAAPVVLRLLGLPGG